jgi:sugar lactone lactonase YvrE
MLRSMTAKNSVLLFAAALLSPAFSSAQPVLPARYQIFTLMGADGCVDGIPATSAFLRGPYRIAVAPDGTVYFSESFSFKIRKVRPDGIVTTVAGNGTVGTAGDGGPAVVAQIGADINGLALDSAGNLYFGDTNFTVRKVDTSGVVTRFAGTGALGFNGDGGPASAAQLGAIGSSSLATDPFDNVYVATGDNRLRKISPDGVIHTIAGTGQASHSGDGGPALTAALDRPSALAIDPGGSLYIAEGSFRVRRISRKGVITTVAGNGAYGFSGEDVIATSAALGVISSLAVGPDGNLYIGERSQDQMGAPFTRVRRLSAEGKLTTAVAGRGVGFTRSGVLAVEAQAGWITGLAFGPAGDLYFIDHYNQQISRMDTSGVVQPVAGRERFAGDGFSAYHAMLNAATGIATDAKGNIYVGGVWNRRIRNIDTTLAVSTFAGNGIFGDYGDGFPAEAASLGWTNQMVALHDGGLLFADYGNNRVRRVDAAGILTTIAGNGEAGNAGDGGPALLAQLNHPFGVAVGPSGNVYVSEVTGNRIRKITPDGTISTLAGNGTAGYSGDGGPAHDALLNAPRGLALDPNGNLFVADGGNLRIRRISADGTISTLAGNGKSGWTGDGGPATSASINGPFGLALDPSGSLIFTTTAGGALTRGGKVMRVRPDGTIDTIAGTGDPGAAGDGGFATDATFNFPDSLAIDSTGAILVTDRFNHRVRVLTPVM